jgi:hypothetical protein
MFLVESYGTDTSDAFSDASERARLVAELCAAVRYVRTMFLPDEETLLHVFEAPTAAVLADAAQLATLDYERIVDAVEQSEGVKEVRDAT